MADLSNASAANTEFDECDLSGAKLARIDLTGSTLTGACLEGADLTEANLQNAQLTGVRARGARLGKASLFKANLTSADLSGADLSEVDLRDANLTRQTRRATLTGARSRYARATSIEQLLAAWVDVSLGSDSRRVAIDVKSLFKRKGHRTGARPDQPAILRSRRRAAAQPFNSTKEPRCRSTACSKCSIVLGRGTSLVIGRRCPRRLPVGEGYHDSRSLSGVPARASWGEATPGDVGRNLISTGSTTRKRLAFGRAVAFG
jgi:hypothetical protein